MEQPYSDTNAGLHYDLRLDIDPQTHFLAVTGSVAYHSPTANLERARFYLHRQLAIQSLAGRRVLGYHYETGSLPPAPNLPQAGVLDVYFDPPLRLNETALVQFEYSGHVTDWPAESVNILSADWCELGAHLPWFPYQYDGTPSMLTFTLKVVCPAGYQVSSYGPFASLDGAWYFTWAHPTTDIVVAVGRSLRTYQFESAPNQVLFAAATFEEATAIQLGEDLLWMLERFSGWFGPTRPAEFTVIESPRLLGGGYASRGLVVLSGVEEHDYLSQREAYLRYLAHEAAHAWWWEAPTGSWEDWLNESLAEYSALLVVRERFSPEIFERFLERKRDRVTDALPLWEFDRSDTATPEKQALVERMLYDRGPLLLHELAQRIGSQRYFELCRAMLWSGVTDTRHMLDLLEELEGGETRQWMEDHLRKASIPG
jgi:hypothetical protein